MKAQGVGGEGRMFGRIASQLEGGTRIVTLISALGLGQCLLPFPMHAAPLLPQETSGTSARAQETSQVANYQAIAREYEDQLKTRPQSARLWSNLGAVRAMQGDCPASLEALKHASALDPKLFVPWYFRGYCHLADHQDASALDELKQATKLNSKDANAWFLEAEAAGRLNQPALSFQAALRSLFLDSRRPEGFYLAGQDALEMAKEQYDYVVSHQPNPFALRLRAERNAGQGVWAPAITDYQKAQALSPGFPAIPFELGSAYLEAGNYAEAESEFHLCLDQLPDSSWAELRLALALAAQSKKSQAQEILESVQPAKLASPSEWEDFIAAEYLAGRTDAAAHLLSQAESSFPNVPAWDAWTRRLAAQRAMPDTPAQLSFEFERPGVVALSVSFILTARRGPDNFVRPIFPSLSGFQSFRTAFLQGNALASAAQMMPFVPALPHDPERAFVTGEILHRLALDFFERLETEYPNSEPAMVLAGENYSASGDQAKAIAIYTALLRNEGPSPEILRDLAKVYWTQYHWDKALAVLQQLAQVDPYDPTIFVNLGRIYSYQQKVREAEENFRIAARMRPGMYEAHLGLGEVLERVGEEKGAISELKVAELVEPSSPRPHYLLSQIYRKLGEKDLAAKEMANFQRLQALMGPGTADQGNRLVPLD